MLRDPLPLPTRSGRSQGLLLVGLAVSLLLLGGVAWFLLPGAPGASRSRLPSAETEALVRQVAEWVRNPGGPLPGGGPGIVICEPLAWTPSRETSEFGAGCARWLQLNVAANPELGTTPPWISIDSARLEIGGDDLRLDLPLASRLRAILGITHAAIGDIQGTPDHCVLAYQVWSLPDRRPVGRSITLSGTEAQVLAGLPAAAQQIALDLGVKSPRGASHVGVDASGMTLLGRVPWAGRGALAEEDLRSLKSLEPNEPLAAVLLLNPSLEDGRQRDAEAESLLKRLPDHPVVLAQAAAVSPTVAAHHTSVVYQALRQFPACYPLDVAAVNLSRDSGSLEAELRAAEQAVKCNPRDPHAWLELGWSISSLDQAIRGHALSPGSPAEERAQAQCEVVDRAWLRVVLQAVRLDPDSGRGWLRVSTAARFNGNVELADQAFWKASSLDRGDPDLYWWGLELYQPRWSPDPVKLRRVANLAAADDGLDAPQALSVGQNLGDAGFPEQAATVLRRVMEESLDRVRRDPTDALPHYWLAAAYRLVNDSRDAQREYRTYLSLSPGDQAADYDLSNLVAGAPAPRIARADNAQPLQQSSLTP